MARQVYEKIYKIEVPIPFPLRSANVFFIEMDLWGQACNIGILETAFNKDFIKGGVTGSAAASHPNLTFHHLVPSAYPVHHEDRPLIPKPAIPPPVKDLWGQACNIGIIENITKKKDEL